MECCHTVMEKHRHLMEKVNTCGAHVDCSCAEGRNLLHSLQRIQEILLCKNGEAKKDRK